MSQTAWLAYSPPKSGTSVRSYTFSLAGLFCLSHHKSKAWDPVFQWSSSDSEGTFCAPADGDNQTSADDSKVRAIASKHANQKHLQHHNLSMTRDIFFDKT